MRSFIKGVRRFRGVLPFFVWGASIVVAVKLHLQVTVGGKFVGYVTNDSVDIRPSEACTVREVYVRPHEAVELGQLLIVLDDEEERIKLAAVELDIKRLTAAVTAEQTRIQQDLMIARREGEDLLRRFLIDREAAQLEYLNEFADHARNCARLQEAQIEYDVVKSLADNGAGNLRELNEARGDFESLEALVKGTGAVVARAKSAFEDADRRWALFAEQRNAYGEWDPILTPLRLAVDVRMKDLQEIVRQIDARVLRSPISGVVTTLAVHRRQQFLPGDLLLRVSPTLSHLVLTVVPEETARAISVGTPVVMRRVGFASADTQVFYGTVDSLSSIVAEADSRFRTIPSVPFWGRNVLVSVPETVPLVPGEAMQIDLMPVRSEQPGVFSRLRLIK